jgi:nucleoside-diphosphate-sugar epimerase
VTRVLVTGGTGFIGRQALAALAERGFEVHAVARREPPAELASLAAWHQFDLLDPEGAEGAVAAAEPTHLLHLAWFAEHGAFWTSPENVRWVEASLRLLRVFAGSGGRRAVMAGTCAEYDWSFGTLVEEETPLRPATLYGAAKRGLHEVARAYAAGAGFDLAWGRVFFLYGPHEDAGRLVSSVIGSLLRGEEARTSEGTQVRDFLHVADVADAFAALLASDVTGAVNVASGDGIEIRKVVQRIGELTGREDLLSIGALPARDGDPPQLVADVRRLRDEVGWRPHFSLDQGLREAVDWWRGELARRP